MQESKMTQETKPMNQGGLVKLNIAQEVEISVWADDKNNLWGSYEARRINLTTFARSIIAKAVAPPSSEPPTQLKQSVALAVYDLLRQAHKSIAAIQHDFTLNGIAKCSVEAVDSALYVSEHVIMEEMER